MPGRHCKTQNIHVRQHDTPNSVLILFDPEGFRGGNHVKNLLIIFLLFYFLKKFPGALNLIQFDLYRSLNISKMELETMVFLITVLRIRIN